MPAICGMVATEMGMINSDSVVNTKVIKGLSKK